MAFYRSGRAAYDLCATGGLRLVPVDDIVADHLRVDYEEMIRAGYFDGSQPEFDDILTRLSELQSQINAPFSLVIFDGVIVPKFGPKQGRPNHEDIEVISAFTGRAIEGFSYR